MTATRGRGAVYELTVVGRLGPVLQAMLEPVAATTSCERRTILCLRARDGLDLVDVLQLLGSRGLEATAVSVID